MGWGCCEPALNSRMKLCRKGGGTRKVPHFSVGQLIDALA